MLYRFFESPVGRLSIAGDGKNIHLIAFSQGCRAIQPPENWRRDDTLYRTAVDQLKAYFSGHITTFDLPIKPSGTPFQLAVWAALQEIPYGETTTYSDIATKLKNPRAVRAVGAANGANPIPIVIPCHRVIGRDGALTGFGGGLPAKENLLTLERDIRQKMSLGA